MSKTVKPKARVIDLGQLTPAERERVEHALEPRRDTVLSLRFANANVEKWRAAAEAEGMSMTDWVEKALDKQVGHP